MYKQIESSEGNYGCEHILYYVEGSNRTINRFVEKRANDIMLYLRNNHIPCIRVSVMGVDFFGTNSLKNLFLRQEPTLTPSELKKKIKEFQNIKRDGRFIYSAINNYNEDGAATYITYEETISYSSSTYKKIYINFSTSSPQTSSSAPDAPPPVFTRHPIAEGIAIAWLMAP